jgi:hypothetical protein
VSSTVIALAFLSTKIPVGVLTAKLSALGLSITSAEISLKFLVRLTVAVSVTVNAQPDANVSSVITLFDVDTALPDLIIVGLMCASSS